MHPESQTPEDPDSGIRIMAKLFGLNLFRNIDEHETDRAQETAWA